MELPSRASSDPLINFIQGIQQFVLKDAVFYPEYKYKPVEFANEILGITWTPQIQRVALDLLEYEKVGVPAGHGVGKTHGVAGMIIWWMATRKTKVVTTAPTWRQVKDLLWRELRSQHRKSKRTLPGEPLQVGWDLDEA